MNALASVIRGTGNMLVPSLAVCLGIVLLVPLSPLFIFGWGPVPALGIAGGGARRRRHDRAHRGRARLVHPLRPLRRQAAPGAAGARRFFADILRVGGVGAISTLQTTLTVALTTALVGAHGGPDAVAGYGTGARLEYLLIPLVFGLGAPMVALVGTNIGAGQRERALRIALTGGALAFAISETVGLAAAIWPHAWLGLFGHDPRMLDDRRRLPARRRADVRLLRPRPVALLRVAGRRQARLAADRRHAAAASSRSAAAGSSLSLDRLAGVGVRGPRARARRLRRDDRQRDRVGELVQALIGGAQRRRVQWISGSGLTPGRAR